MQGIYRVNHKHHYDATNRVVNLFMKSKFNCSMFCGVLTPRSVGDKANVSQQTVWVCFKNTGFCSAHALQPRLGSVRDKAVKLDLLQAFALQLD